MPDHYDVAVIGLGAFGSAAAYHLAARGHDVVALDAFEPPHARGSSHGETRIIREAFFEDPSYVHRVRRAYELWAALEAATDTQLYRRTGGLFVGPPDGELLRGVRAAVAQHGIAHDDLDAGAVRERFPPFTPDDGTEALVEHRAGVLYVERCVRAHLAAARAQGANLRVNERVEAWHATGRRIRLTTARGPIEAESLVVAGGPWMPALLAPLGLPLVATRQVQLWFQPAREPGTFGPDHFPIFGVEHAQGELVYGLPDVGSGVKVGLHALGEETTPDTVERGVRADEVEAMREVLRRFVPALDGPLRRDSVCLYTATPDRHFVVDHHPDHDNVVLLGGGSGHGFKFSPAIGEAAADLVEGKAPRVPLGLFGVGRLG